MKRPRPITGRGPRLARAAAVRRALPRWTAVLVAVVAVPAVSPAQTSVPYDAEARYAEALQQQMYAEAEVAAKELVEQAIAAGRRDELPTATSFARLAHAQRKSGKYDAALLNYDAAVSIIEANTDRLNVALVQPLNGIGMTHLDNRRPDLALASFQRALHVRQVNDGPHALAQVDSLEPLVTAYADLGDVATAAATIGRWYRLHERSLGAQSANLVPVLLRRGKMLERVALFDQSIDAYRQAVSLAGAPAPAVLSIRPRIDLGSALTRRYFRDYFRAESEEELPEPGPLESAEEHLRRAYALAGALTADQWRLRSEVQLALGDYYTMTDTPGRARQFYREAWQLLTTGSRPRLDHRRTVLEEVVPLLQPLPDLGEARHDDLLVDRSAYELGYVETAFTVDSRGRAKDVVLVGIEPGRDPDVEAAMKQSLSGFVYRPRFDGGFVVETPDTAFRYEYLYTPDDE